MSHASAKSMEDGLAFTAHWFDRLASIDKPFRIMFYPYDHSVEIIDLRSKKQTLKRIKIDSFSQSDIYLGNSIDIYGRRYKIVEFADQQTRD